MTVGIPCQLHCANVLVRYLVRDDEAQFTKARALIRRETAAGRRILISLVVLLETESVLRSRYRLRKDNIRAAISGLLDTSDFELESEPSVEAALHVWKKSRADFADCLIGVHYCRLGCEATVTFDTKTSSLAGFVLA